MAFEIRAVKNTAVDTNPISLTYGKKVYVSYDIEYRVDGGEWKSIPVVERHLGPTVEEFDSRTTLLADDGGKVSIVEEWGTSNG